LATLALTATASAQEAAPAEPPEVAGEPSWGFGLSGALYVLPDEEDFVQPTFKADRGILHLETRYNYEDRESASFFAGRTSSSGTRSSSPSPR